MEIRSLYITMRHFTKKRNKTDKREKKERKRERNRKILNTQFITRINIVFSYDI